MGDILNLKILTKYCSLILFLCTIVRAVDTDPTVADFSDKNVTGFKLKGIRGQLQKTPSVTQLDFRRNSLGPRDGAALSALVKQQSADSLDLSENQLSDTGLLDLVESVLTLTTLRLGKNKIRVPGVQAIANNLAQSTTLQELDLSQNEFGDAGLRAILVALETNQSLTTLNVAGDLTITDESLKLMAKICSTKNTTLRHFTLGRTNTTIVPTETVPWEGVNRVSPVGIEYLIDAGWQLVDPINNIFTRSNPAEALAEALVETSDNPSDASTREFNKTIPG